MYECHITTTVAHAEEATRLAASFGWKTSEIKRDPVLGDGSYFYLTAHHKNFREMYGAMRMVAGELRAAGCGVLREKIEHIVYDTKTGVGV